MSGLDTAALFTFLGLLVGAVFKFALDVVRWYQDKALNVLETQQATLEKLYDEGQNRDRLIQQRGDEAVTATKDILTVLDERLPHKGAGDG